MAEANQDKPGSSGFKVTDRRRAEREPAPEPAAPPPPEPKPADARAERAELPQPPIDFTTFVLSFASTALIQMGIAPDPETGKTEADPVLARGTIDLLGMLREKTRGNLTDEESKFFDALLYDLRVRFVEITKS
jgi:hypothetical protein